MGVRCIIESTKDIRAEDTPLARLGANLMLDS